MLIVALANGTVSYCILCLYKRNSNITDVTDSQISIQKQMAGKQTHREPPDLTLNVLAPSTVGARINP
jgi:hypothetical protein